MDTNSLSHTKWECKYHVVFAPKYRRKVIYGELRKEIGTILRTLCERKGIELIEGECCPDHIHMLIRIPPKESVSDIIGYSVIIEPCDVRCVPKEVSYDYKYTGCSRSQTYIYRGRDCPDAEHRKNYRLYIGKRRSFQDCAYRFRNSHLKTIL